MFPPLALKTLRWRSLEGEGLEHLTIRAYGSAIIAESVVISSEADAPVGARYRIECDAGWHVRVLEIATTTGASLHLLSDGTGNWQTPDGIPQPNYDGCIDIDLSVTPFTNTLPIRRLRFGPSDGPVSLTMLYVPFETLEPRPDGQIYTCLEPARRYLYQAAERPFFAELATDADGLVTDYPGLFERVI